MYAEKRYFSNSAARAVEGEDRTMRVSFSSEYDQGMRWFGIEVLSHKRGAVRLDRLKQGAAVLVEHDTENHVGTTKNPAIEERRGYVDVRFGSDDDADKVLRQVTEGIKKDTSVGYIVHHITERGRRSDGTDYERAVPVDEFRSLVRSLEEKRQADRSLFLRKLDAIVGAVDRAAGDVPVFEVDDWEPYEVSWVAIPFDPTVGADRSLAAEAATPKESPMGDTTTAAPAAPSTAQQPDIRVIESQAQRAERDRAKQIRAMGQELQLTAEAEHAIEAGTSVEAFCRVVADKMVERGKLTPTTAAPELGLSKKEKQRYSLTRLMYALLEPNDASAQREASFEIGLSVEARKLQPIDETNENAKARLAGYRVPFDILTDSVTESRSAAEEAVRMLARIMAKRDLNVGTSTAGGNLVATDLLASSFIDLLRNRMKLAQLGATMLDGLVGNLAIPSQSAGASTYWVTEGTAVTESEAAFGQVALTPKTVGMFTDYTRRAMLQTTPSVEALVRADLAAGIGVEIDRAGIAGSGSSGQPRGIINQSGIGAVAGGTNGAAPTYANMVALEEAVAIANADVGSMAYLTNAKMRAQLRLTQVFASTNGAPVWASDNTVLGYRAEVSNNAPSNLTKGTSSGVCSAIIFGNFSDLLIGMWSGLDLVLDPYALATSGGRRIVALQDVDTAVRRAASFAAMLDALRT